MRAFEQVHAGHGVSTLIPDFDFETYSEAGYYWDGPAYRWRGLLKSKPGLQCVGAPAYAENPSTEILSLAYNLKDGRGDRLWVPELPPPQELFDYIANGGILEAWNSAFEFYIWHFVCNFRMGWPPLPLAQLRCAMAKGAAWGLPGKLGKAAKVVNVTEQKDATGESLIKKLSIPKNPTKKMINEYENGTA